MTYPVQNLPLSIKLAYQRGARRLKRREQKEAAEIKSRQSIAIRNWDKRLLAWVLILITK